MQILVCALQCEAKPLIEHFHLKAESNEAPFKIYRNQEKCLVVTGIGKIPSGAGCGYVQGRLYSQDAIWLNVGVCGGNHPVGTPFLIHKITDQARNAEFFPSFSFSLPCLSASLITVESPQKKIEEGFLYDMEGAGFFEIARRFSTLEFIHCLKIVSDQGTTWLEKAEVSALIASQIPLIESLLSTLGSLQIPQSQIFETGLTVTERHELKRLLERCEALGLKPPCHHPKQLKKFLENHVPTHLH